MRGDCNMICWFKQEECSHLMPASLVYSKSVIECLLHCLLNIPRNIGDAFFYVITCVYTSWKTVVLLFLFHVLDCNAIFANQDLLSTLRPGNFDLHTKMPGSAPAWAVVHKCPVCADLLLVGRRSERLCRRLVGKKTTPPLLTSSPIPAIIHKFLRTSQWSTISTIIRWTTARIKFNHA